MSFIIVLTAVLMVRQGEWIQPFQKDDWFVGWVHRVTTAGQPSWLPLLLVIALPAVLLAAILFFLDDYRWAAFIINTGVLLYAIGRGSWHDECDAWVLFFAERDLLVLKQKIAEQGVAPSDVADSQIEKTWQQARSDVLYHQLDGFYTVVFWFFLVGAPAALLYRLLHLYQQHTSSLQHDHSATNTVAKNITPEIGWLLWMMEWLPVRVMAMLFCLVGNFTTGFWVLKKIILDGVLASTEILARCADAALFLDGSVDDDELLGEEVDPKATRTAKMIERMEARNLEQKTPGVMRRYSVELQALLQRSEWAFLVLIALIAVL